MICVLISWFQVLLRSLNDNNVVVLVVPGNAYKDVRSHCFSPSTAGRTETLVVTRRAQEPNRYELRRRVVHGNVLGWHA